MLRFQKWAPSSTCSCSGCRKRAFSEYVCGMVSEKLGQGATVGEMDRLLEEAVLLRAEAAEVDLVPRKMQ